MSFKIKKTRNGFSRHPEIITVEENVVNTQPEDADFLSEYTSSLFLDEKYLLFDLDKRPSNQKVEQQVTVTNNVNRSGKTGKGMRMRRNTRVKNEDGC